ncbi:MAG: protein-disulfide reductase DsbD domain-containing protein, partial [Pseudomonadota bacterium]|nr:protein-disulfide reductase DsbD domain-containing protein [Pseudomonadota bacterium]
MKKKLIIVSFFSLLSHTQIFDSNNFIPTADEAFILSADIENQSILVNFKLVPETYIYLDKVNLIDSEDSNIKFEFLGKKEEKEDSFFGLIEIVNSDFKIKFSSEDKEKIVLNYQGCYKNKVC